MPFSVAGVALRDILTCLQTCRESFCVTYAILLQGFQQMSWIFRRRCSIWETSIIILRSAALLTCRAACYLGIALSGLRQVVTLHTQHFTLFIYTPHSTLNTFHSTLYTPHFTLYTPHSALYTPHSALYTLHSTLHTPHFTLHTSHFTLYTLHSTLYTPHSTLYTLHSTLNTLHSTLRTLHSTLHTLYSTLYTLYSTLYALYSTLHSLHSTLHALHFKLFRILQSTVHWYGNRGSMYKIVQITCFTKVFDVTAFGFVGCILVIFHGHIHLEVSIVKGVTPNGRFAMENPSINGWFAGILILGNPHMSVCLPACLPACLCILSRYVNIQHIMLDTFIVYVFIHLPIYMHMYTQQDTSICTFDGIADQDQWNTWCFSTPSHLKAPIKHVKTSPCGPTCTCTQPASTSGWHNGQRFCRLCPATRHLSHGVTWKSHKYDTLW